ncbi:MAG: methyltransferase domain-containing protein [Chloroflexota bacterium]|nr:methyltransferase domain-containing protein [Chloroflexota bacterium]
MSGDNPFDAIARFYDWEHADFDDDVPLYRGFARRTGGPILELACGTGRLMRPLLELGERVVGVDSSEEMLARARRALDAAGLLGNAQLHRADVRSLALEERFRLAIFGLDSFGLLSTTADQLAALGRIREHLVPGGLLVLDVANGNRRGGEAPDELQLQHIGPDPATGRQISKWTARGTDLGAQLDRFTYFYDEVGEDGAVRRWTTGLALRYFGRYELELLLERAGLILEALYGGYDLAPYGGDSERLIAVAGRPAL